MILQRKRTPADAPIAISAGDLSTWSWRLGTCGEVVKGKGLGLRIRSESGFLAPFNGLLRGLKGNDRGIKGRKGQQRLGEEIQRGF